MFDLLFDGFTAFNQMGFLLGGFIFTMASGGFIGNWIWWRLKSYRVKARVVGVRALGKRQQSTVRKEEASKPEDKKKQEKSAKGVGVFFILFSMIFIVIGLWQIYKYIDLSMNGIETTGEVVDYHESYDSDSGTSYYAIVSFRDLNGRSHREKNNVSGRDWGIGEEIAVYYDSNKPERFVVKGWKGLMFGVLFAGFASIFTLVGFLLATGRIGDNRAKIKVKDRAYDFQGEHYKAIYEYTAKDGQRIEAEGSVASNWLADKIPGQYYTVMVMPDQPDVVRKPRLLFLIFGLVFLPGALLFFKGAFEMGFNIFSLLIPLGVLAFGGFKFYGFYQDKIKPEIEKMGGWDQMWEDMQSQGIKSKNSDQGKGKLLSESEFAVRLRYYDKYSKIWTPFVILIAIGMVTGSYYTGQDMIRLSQEGLRAQGTIISHESRRDSEGNYTYYPVVAFMTEGGERIKFTDNTGSSHPTKKTGKEVRILYPADKPGKAIIDRGLANWFLSLGLAGGGALIFLYGLKIWTGIERRSKLVN